MILDGLRFRDAAGRGTTQNAIASFLEFIERKTGVTILYDSRRIPFDTIELREPVRIAASLKRLGIITEFNRARIAPDEPQIRSWWCKLAVDDKNVGGASFDNDANALFAALAEGMERHLWFAERDYFLKPRSGTVSEIGAKFPILAPERFAGFSEEQQEKLDSIRQYPSASYLWIQGESLVTGRKTYLPAQTATASWRPHNSVPREPLIRTQVTTGLATWTTQAGARLRGALECIERDAYMIWWFNQLMLPRISVRSLCASSPSLSKLVAHCERYRLQVHVLPLLTDAPTHALCVVLEDRSDVGPRYAFGLKAHRSLASAIEGAMMEALRARLFTRFADPADHYDPSKGVGHIGHRGRVHYWQRPEHNTHLEQFLSGPIRDAVAAQWEHDSEEEHLERILMWCRERGYECVSVPFGISKKNPTQWHIESVVIPELVPTHLTENLRHLGGTRLSSVPEMFGHEPRSKPFTDRPHPFC